MQQPAPLNVLLHRVPEAIAHSHESINLSISISDIARTFISDLEARRQIHSQGIEKPLIQAWKIIANYFAPSSQDSPHSGFAEEHAVLTLGTSIARLCRNVLAEVEENKTVIWPSEPAIRQVVYFVTNFDRIATPSFFPLQRSLLQLLSNLMAPIKSPIDLRLWEVYLSGKREDEILHRALDSIDPGVCMPVLIITLHSIEGSPAGMRLLLSESGIRLIQRISDKMTAWHEGASAGGMEERCFDLGWKVFEQLFEQGVQGEMFEVIGSPGEPISPTQTTLLRLLDAHLSTTSATHHSSQESDFLLPVFFRLSKYSLSAMSSGSLKDDPLLPKVFEGLMLVVGILRGIGEREVEDERTATLAERGAGNMRRKISEVNEDGKGIVEVIIGLLAKLEVFIPRIKPFRAPAANPSASVSPIASTDCTVSEDNPTTEQTQPWTKDDLQPFAYLKRDLVQFLGVLVYEDQGSQDRVRECGGVQVVLGLCVGDEMNPYIREHALFTVRNLMMGNRENQAVIGEMDPVGVVDEETGELKEMPERIMGRKAG